MMNINMNSDKEVSYHSVRSAISGGPPITSPQLSHHGRLSHVSTSSNLFHTYDVVLMDYEMQHEVNGAASTKMIRDLGYCGAVIGVTAHTMPSVSQQFAAAGADDVLTKPLDMRLFMATYRAITHKEQEYLSEEEEEGEEDGDGSPDNNNNNDSATTSNNSSPISRMRIQNVPANIVTSQKVLTAGASAKQHGVLRQSIGAIYLNKRALVVDPTNLTLKLTSRSLAKLGFTVDEACSLEDAIKQCERATMVVANQQLFGSSALMMSSMYGGGVGGGRVAANSLNLQPEARPHQGTPHNADRVTRFNSGDDSEEEGRMAMMMSGAVSSVNSAPINASFALPLSLEEVDESLENYRYSFTSGLNGTTGNVNGATAFGLGGLLNGSSSLNSSSSSSAVAGALHGLLGGQQGLYDVVIVDCSLLVPRRKNGRANFNRQQVLAATNGAGFSVHSEDDEAALSAQGVTHLREAGHIGPVFGLGTVTPKESIHLLTLGLDAVLGKPFEAEAFKKEMDKKEVF
jgi:CheY-like chemotaxis protein